MSRQKLTLPILISFNELVWIVAFALAVLYVSQTVRTKELSKEIEADKSRQAELQTTLENIRQEAMSQQVVGLKGDFHRVVIVIDRSGSMKYRHKWNESRAIIATWLKYLPVDECALVTFNDTVSTYPENGAFLDLHGPNREANRGILLDRLNALKPEGNTNTLAALHRAYSYGEVDTIILFTDGFPDSGSNRFNQEMARAIYRLCQRHGTNVPINTVGLGKYFDRRLEVFLRRLPELTGGTFVGR